MAILRYETKCETKYETKPKMILETFRIRYGNEAISITLKFKKGQTFKLWYPAQFDPAITGTPYHCVTEHLMEASNYWWAMSRLVGDPRYDTHKVMYRRTKVMQAYLEKYIEQEIGRGWK